MTVADRPVATVAGSCRLETIHRETYKNEMPGAWLLMNESHDDNQYTVLDWMVFAHKPVLVEVLESGRQSR